LTHRLQLFDTSESLVESVASFLFEGYVRGEHLVMVAKPRHRQGVMAALRRMGCFPPDADTPQRLVGLDAAEVLRTITRDGRLDAALFKRTIKPLVKSLSATSQVRIYGEAVELLAEQQDLDTAFALEQMWNALGAEIPFTLLCGYSSAHFTTPASQRSLRAICGTHTHVAAEADDTLGRYLLAIA
jgi:DcmR-like sensory protein